MREIQPLHWESHAKKRREADTNLTDLVRQIQTKAGFETFLLPMTAEDMMATADPDPLVVINLYAVESDAFLIESHQIRSLSLPELTTLEARTRVNELRSSMASGCYDIGPLLKWLWTAVCRPCLEELGFDRPITDGNWPRIWWIPTEELCQLPLHAAGIHEKGSNESVLDRVMSSYSVSVQALRHGRQRVRSASRDSSTPNQAILVSMPRTPGHTRLPYAEKEVTALYDLCPSLHLDPVKPKSRKDDTLHHLRQCIIFHFAGHGHSDHQDPSKSYLLLDDWQDKPLTVSDLQGIKLQDNPPFLGYLSACSTGSSEKQQLLNESLHLVGAFQLAGFRHVIGTLWSVSDQHSADVAQTFYETLRWEGLTDRAVCKSLHEAVRKLRYKQLEEVLDVRDANWPFGAKDAPKPGWGDQHWVPYVHFGV